MSTSRHPKGLYLIFATSTAERFSYYGMRAIFILFLTQALLFDKEHAASIYGSYTGLVYLTPLIGGYIADKYWGIRRSVFWGAMMMAVGQFLMFASASMLEARELSHWLMYGGLTFLILGNGCFKPTVSSLVGQLYEPGDKRLDSAYTIFYMGVNVGSFLAPLVCGYFGETGNPHDFRWGFLIAAIVTVLTVVLFETQKNKYLIGPDGKPRALHVENALDVTLCTPPVKHDFGEHLAQCEYFSVLARNGAFEGVADEKSFVSLLVTDGEGELTCGGETVVVKKGDSFFLPAGSGSYAVRGTCQTLVTRV